jgi:hypothetical protein
MTRREWVRLVERELREDAGPELEDPSPEAEAKLRQDVDAAAAEAAAYHARLEALGSEPADWPDDREPPF